MGDRDRSEEAVRVVGGREGGRASTAGGGVGSLIGGGGGRRPRPLAPGKKGTGFLGV